MGGRKSVLSRYGLVVLLVLVVAGTVAYLLIRDRTPAEFTGRAVLTACGTVDQPALGGVPVSAAEQCLTDAMRDGRGAELVVTGMTDEGARVLAYHRAVPGRPGLEIFDDLSSDRFSDAGWVHRSCPGARGPAAPGECASRDLPARW